MFDTMPASSCGNHVFGKYGVIDVEAGGKIGSSTD